MQAKQRASPFWDCQPPSSIAIYRRYARFAVAQAGQEGNPGLKTAGNLAISVKYAKETVGLSGARLLRDRQTARNSRIPDQQGRGRSETAVLRRGGAPLDSRRDCRQGVDLATVEDDRFSNRPRRSQPFPGCVALETKSNLARQFPKTQDLQRAKKAEPADADTAIAAPQRCAIVLGPPGI